jgi:AcrR family transcriptional regulator
VRTRIARVAGHMREQHAKRVVETRARLLEVALDLFAEHGYHRVTVRDIVRHARVNLAAVSYHFGDKFGLYTEIVENAIAMIRSVDDTSIERGSGQSPEDKLRQFVRVYLPRVAKPQGRVALVQRLMRHEMANPTPLARRVAQEGLAPRVRYLSEVVREILVCEPDDERIVACVMSIQAQCLIYMPNRVRSNWFPNWPPTTEAELTRAAEYVAEFCVAGVRAIAAKGVLRD